MIVPDTLPLPGSGIATKASRNKAPYLWNFKECCFLVLCGFYFAELIGTRVLGNPGGFESIKKHKKTLGKVVRTHSVQTISSSSTAKPYDPFSRRDHVKSSPRLSERLALNPRNADFRAVCWFSK